MVNAANTHLLWGGGVCGALFEAAGEQQMQAACDTLSPIKPGEAVITPGFNLPAKYVIHAVGPIYRDGRQGEEDILRSAYKSALRLAQEHHLSSVAFPLISSGAYGYPHDKALHIAINTIRTQLNEMDDEEPTVTLVLFDRSRLDVDPELRRRLESGRREMHFRRAIMRSDTLELGEELNAHQIDAIESMSVFPSEERAQPKAAQTAKAPMGLEELIKKKDESFSTLLLRIIDAKGFKDAEVYKRANLDRKHFSKIRSNKGYAPSKETVLALAVGMELSLTETKNLLARAGFALSSGSDADIIVAYYIENGQYDIDRINHMLYKYDQSLLGSKAT